MAAPAAAQVNGIGVTDPRSPSPARRAADAYQQIGTTYPGAAHPARAAAAQHDTLVRQFDTNHDGQLSEPSRPRRRPTPPRCSS
jgi:hypothetical protein